MEFINLAYSQLNCDGRKYMHHPFFREYFKVLNFNDNFYKTANKLMEDYTMEEINESISF